MKKMFTFAYDVYYGDELIAQDTVDFKLTAAEIEEIAEIMDDNNGYPVDLCALESLSDLLVEEILCNKLTEQVPDDADYERIEVRLQEEMPEDLVAAADEFVRMKVVTMPYYVEESGIEVRKEVSVGISPKAFNAMRAAAVSGKVAENDFALLKELDEKAHHEICDIMTEYTYKEGMSKDGKPWQAGLKEFPYQVYDNL